jgi:3-phenylpropionate/cinnamic acid dioxygenase small subunit
VHNRPVDPTADDHAAITNLLARYCLALDVDDIDAWVTLFTSDATFEVFGRSWEGHGGLQKMMRGAPRGLHLGGLPVIEMVGPDHARTTQNLLFVEVPTGTLRRSIYTDELRRTDQGWRIASRRCQFIVADGLADRPDESNRE